MLILGIDTSCDDTCAAIVDSGRSVISSVVSSQNEIHDKYGGIVPELASRRHIEMIWPVLNETIIRAGVDFRNISALAVSYGPGLIGSLLVGVCFAKSLSYAHKIPMVAVNHLEGHIHSIFLEHNPGFPFLALVVSGGHTSIYRVDDFGKYKEVGRTRDDAAGEAYDKVSKLLGFGYPGGPVIDQIAKKGDPTAIKFPKANLKGTFDFSFSGLKTAVMNYVRKFPEADKNNVAASFQSAVVDVLIDTTLNAAKQENINRIVLAGGVSANSSLRASFIHEAKQKGLTVYLPSLNLCTDNAAMIAAAGYRHFKTGDIANYSLNPVAYLPLCSAND